MSVIGIQVGKGIQQAVDPLRRDAREAKQLEVEREIAKQQYAIDNNLDQQVMANELETAKANLSTVQEQLSQTRVEQSKLNMGSAFRMLQAGNLNGFHEALAQDKKRFGADSIANQVPWISHLHKLDPEKDKEERENALNWLKGQVAERLGYSEQDLTDPVKAKEVAELAQKEGFIYRAYIDDDAEPDYFTDTALMLSLGGMTYSEIAQSRDGYDYTADRRLTPEGLGRPLTEDEKKELEAKRKAAAKKGSGGTAGERLAEEWGKYSGALINAILNEGTREVADLIRSTTNERSLLGGDAIDNPGKHGQAIFKAIGYLNSTGKNEGKSPIAIDEAWLDSRANFIEATRAYWRNPDGSKERGPTFANFEETVSRFRALQRQTNSLMKDTNAFSTGTKEGTAEVIRWVAERFGISDVDSPKALLRELENEGTATLMARIATEIAGTQITDGEIKHILGPIAGKDQGETAKFAIRMMMLDTLNNRILQMGREYETKNDTAAGLADTVMTSSVDNLEAFSRYMSDRGHETVPTASNFDSSSQARQANRLFMTSVTAVSNRHANTRFLARYGYTDRRIPTILEANLFTMKTESQNAGDARQITLPYVYRIQQYLKNGGTITKGFAAGYNETKLKEDIDLLYKTTAPVFAGKDSTIEQKEYVLQTDLAISRLTEAYKYMLQEQEVPVGHQQLQQQQQSKDGPEKPL